MNLLLTVFFTVVCPNETFDAFEENLTQSEAQTEVEYFKNNPYDTSEVPTGTNCVITNPRLEK